MNERRVLITCLLLIMTACTVVACVSLLGTGIYFLTPFGSIYSADFEETSIPQEPFLSDPGPDGETDLPSPTEPIEEGSSQTSKETRIDPETAQQMDEIQMQVILERGLKPTENIDRTLYSQEQLREKIIQDFNEDYPPEEVQHDAITLAAFGLLDPEFDLYHFYIDLLSEQIAGFFDQDTKEMAIIQNERFGGSERMTYAHEYTHALQDQNFDIENGLNYNEEACETDSERCAAIQALIEGDATLTQMNWFFKNGTAEDRADILQLYSNLDTPVFDSAPDFISLDFTFPYEKGLAFVETLHEKGGWGTVDRAYNDLPLSTEQILHPERYPNDRPIQVDLPVIDEVLGDHWIEIDHGTMGEWYTYLILAKGLNESARIGEGEAARAAEGWGGDAYVVYYKEDTSDTVMVLHAIWDSPQEADEFGKSFRDYADGRFGSSSNDTWQGDDGTHIFIQDSNTTTWILAPNSETAMAIWQRTAP
jgi:hypothetical protein